MFTPKGTIVVNENELILLERPSDLDTEQYKPL
jgi:hypothetical protein